jgi:hypothetical protein
MKKPPRRYQDSIFDKAQVEKLQGLLNLESHEKAVLFALLISTSYYGYLTKNELRRRISDVKNAKRQLKSIANKSKELARMLGEHPISENLVRRRPKNFDEWLEGMSEFEDDNGAIEIARVEVENRKKLSALIEALTIISDSAWFFYDNDEHFRDAVHLPRLKDAEKTAVRADFWPRLFIIWRQAGKCIAGSERPLHDFLTLVHQACDLGNVSASTVRDAVAEWKRHDANTQADYELHFGHPDAAEDLQ